MAGINKVIIVGNLGTGDKPLTLTKNGVTFSRLYGNQEVNYE